MEYGIVEFLNLYCYIKDKNVWENKSLEKYKKH